MASKLYARNMGVVVASISLALFAQSAIAIETVQPVSEKIQTFSDAGCFEAGPVISADVVKGAALVAGDDASCVGAQGSDGKVHYFLASALRPPTKCEQLAKGKPTATTLGSQGAGDCPPRD